MIDSLKSTPMKTPLGRTPFSLRVLNVPGAVSLVTSFVSIEKLKALKLITVVSILVSVDGA